MAIAKDIGPTERERWMAVQVIKAAALVADAMRSADDGEREYGRGELVMTARALIEGDDALSLNQLENLRDFVDLAIECLGKKPVTT